MNIYLQYEDTILVGQILEQYIQNLKTSLFCHTQTFHGIYTAIHLKGSIQLFHSIQSLPSIPTLFIILKVFMSLSPYVLLSILQMIKNALRSFSLTQQHRMV